MKKLNLFMAIFMALITTTLIVLFFYAVPYSKNAAILVTMLSIMGYLGSALYYHNYKDLKDIG